MELVQDNQTPAPPIEEPKTHGSEAAPDDTPPVENPAPQEERVIDPGLLEKKGALAGLVTINHLLNNGHFQLKDQANIQGAIAFLMSLYNKLRDEVIEHPDCELDVDLSLLKENTLKAQEGATNGKV